MRTTKVSLILLIGVLLSLNVKYVYAQQGEWKEKNSFGGIERYSGIGFSIGTKGYVGGGLNNLTFYNDFWEYDPITNVWTQKADFGGTPRGSAVGFAVLNKGYIGTGWDNTNNWRKDFWEYDPATNKWTQKADFGGMPRFNAIGISISNKGYIGTGEDGNGYGGYYKDFWEYDPSMDIWTQKKDFGGTERSKAIGFTIGDKGYIGTGSVGNDGTSFLKDFWEYNPSTNFWTQKADFEGTVRYGAVGFSIGSKGYIGTGKDYDGSFYYSETNDFYEYDQQNDIWSQKAAFLGNPRNLAVGFSIGKFGYLGTGTSFRYNYTNYYKNFYEFDPCPLPIIIQQPIGQTKCTGDSAIFFISASNENYSYQWKKNGKDILDAVIDTLIMHNLELSDTGYYSCNISYKCGNINSNSAKLEINQYLPIGVNLTSDPSGAICSGTNVDFAATPFKGGDSPYYQWKVNGIDQWEWWNHNSTFYSSNLANGDSVSCIMTSNASCILGENQVASNVITMVVDTNTVSIRISEDPLAIKCPGTMVTYTATTVNGGSNPIYQWNVNSNKVGANLPTYAVSTLFNGDTVLCKLISNASCIKDRHATSSSIIVKQFLFYPQASSVDSAICLGNSTILNATGGSKYSWSPGNDLSIINIPNPIASPKETTVYNVEITDANGCIGTTSTKIYVKPTFSINAMDDIVIQSGQSIQLGIKPIIYNVKIVFGIPNGFATKYLEIISSKTGEAVYEFVDPGNSFYGGGVEFIKEFTDGTYMVRALNLNGFDIVPSIGTNATYYFSGYGSYVCSFTVGGTDYLYSWIPGNSLDNSFIAEPIASPAYDTKYIVNVNTNQGCSAMDTVSIKILNGTSLNLQNAKPTYIAYPNPANEKLNILFNYKDNNCSILLYDAIGMLLQQKKVAVNEGSLITLDISAYRKGVYILQVNSESSFSTQKVLIE